MSTVTRAGKPAADGVRLKVAYKTPESLLGELTKSVGRGGVRIESKKSVPVGTQFVFELHSAGIKEVVEVFGTVLSVTESQPGKFVLRIRYQPPTGRSGIDALIQRIFSTAEKDAKRKTARVPVQVRAVENRPESPIYRLRDLSLGGVGIDVEAPQLPPHVRVGMPFVLQMRLTSGTLVAMGEVMWAIEGSAEVDKSKALNPRIGISFKDLAPGMQKLLEDFIALRAMPAPPWIAKLAFGDDAVASLK